MLSSGALRESGILAQEQGAENGKGKFCGMKMARQEPDGQQIPKVWPEQSDRGREAGRRAPSTDSSVCGGTRKGHWARDQEILTGRAGLGSTYCVPGAVLRI